MFSTRRTAFNKILRDKAFNIAKILKYGGYQGDLASMVHKFFDKKTAGGTVKNENISNQELAEELHKTNYQKSQNKESTITFYRQYLERRYSEYAIDKQIW